MYLDLGYFMTCLSFFYLPGRRGLQTVQPRSQQVRQDLYWEWG